MLTSDSNFLLNSKFYTKDNEVNVDIDYRSKEGTMKFKTISLESFITFLKKFNSTDTVLTDTGFLANNLVRKVDTVNSTHYFFFYDKISSTFSSTYSKDVIDFYEKDRIPYIGSKIVITYEDILFHVVYNKNSDSCSYIIYFVEPTYDLMGLKKPLSSDSTLYKNFLPNAFSDSICWGSNLESSLISKAAQNGDIAYLRTLPFIYLNSKFNNDLFFRPYNSTFNIVSTHYKNSEEFITALKKVLGKYYEEDEVNTKIGSLKSLTSAPQFNSLLPLLMNEPSLKTLFFSYLKESVPSYSNEQVIISLEKLCTNNGIQYV